MKTLPLCPRELRAIIRSHGWFDLKPYVTDERSFLRYAFDMPSFRGAFVVSTCGDSVGLRVLNGTADCAATVARRVFAIDWPTTAFHATLRTSEQFGWLVEGQHGRFLRSASLYEDVFKIILTTNTVWDRTRFMNDRATELWGNQIGSLRAFPRPESILQAGEAALRTELGCGYRAPYLLGLAERATAEPDVFFGDAAKKLSSQEFYRLLRSVRGVGEVSAHYVARMYGFNLGFAVDSYVLRRCRELWNVSEKRLPSFLNRRYRGLGSFSSQLLWFEITKHWHDSSRPEF